MDKTALVAAIITIYKNNDFNSVNVGLYDKPKEDKLSKEEENNEEE